MSGSLFRRGGPYNIRQTGADQYTFSIPIEPDEHGRIARACPDDDCSPGYFKVRLGTGITEGQEVAYCPYCRREEEPSGFITAEQLRYGKEVMIREAHAGIGRMFQETLGIGPSGKKKFGGGMFSIEMSYKSGSPPHVRCPFEEEVQRDVVCPHCGLDHAVFGLAVWCPDCGKDILMTHVEAEFGVVRTMLEDVERRREMFGPRIAARDLENCLEDTVSIFEAVLKAFLIRYLRQKGETEEDIQKLLEQHIRNGFQNVDRATEIVRNRMNQELFEGIAGGVFQRLRETFEKRHPITHNLGVIDRKYLEKALEDEREGRDVRVTPDEILNAIHTCIGALLNLHARLFLVPETPPGGSSENTEQQGGSITCG